MAIRGENPFDVFVDTVRISVKEMVIEVAPGRLKVITGKERVF